MEVSQYVNGAYARIILRYLVGAGLMGSSTIGEQLALDPDVVMIVSAIIGVATEAFYEFGKRRGWKL